MKRSRIDAAGNWVWSNIWVESPVTDYLLRKQKMLHNPWSWDRPGSNQWVDHNVILDRKDNNFAIVVERR